MTHTILIIEDEPDLLFTVSLVLEHNGYAVVKAASAEEGLEAVDRAEPDLLLLDLRLPGMDGWAFIERLREDGRFPRIPVVVLSAHASPALERRALEAGCRAYLTKPTPLEKIGRTVADILASPASGD